MRIGLVLHSLTRFIDESWGDYPEALFKDSDDVAFRYDSRGHAIVSEPRYSPAQFAIVRDADFER